VDAALPIVLFVDHCFDHVPFAEALAGELDVRDRVDPADHARVAALVTAIDPIGAAEVAPYPQLRAVLTCSTGVDHLDLEALEALGLIACRTPTYCSEEVADHALACVLGGWRDLWSLGLEVREGGWNPSAVLRRFDRQRLGIVGLGRIGSRLARKALALGVEVVGYDPYLTEAPEGVRAVGLDQLLASSDAISLHMPGTPGQPPLLDAAAVALIKPGAVLVNLSRTSLVDLDAVLAALRVGALASCAFDVWPEEPPAPDDERVRTPGLLLTPHVGWSSPQADDACREEAVAALRAILLTGADPVGLVHFSG
jgi:phosphoglycerate dehydrogenase-like enzyme